MAEISVEIQIFQLFLYCILVTKTKGKNAVFFLLPIPIPFKLYYSPSEEISSKSENTMGSPSSNELSNSNSSIITTPFVRSREKSYDENNKV